MILRAAARLRLAALRAAASDPAPVQRGQLLALLRRARQTRFGREHGLDRVRCAADFRRAVPLRSYEEMAPYWRAAREGEPDAAWPGRTRYWAISSGTTSGEKLLPVSADTIRTNRRGGLDALVPFAAQGEGSLLGGKALFLGGCTALRREGGISIGDNTGIMARQIPRLLRPWHAPGAEIAAIPDWERKVERAAEVTRRQDIRLIGGVPSWILLFAGEVLRRSPGARTLRDVWRNLALFVHGGVAFAPYRARFHALAGPGLWCTDTYSASEGGMLAVQDDPGDPAMLPLLRHGVFFEFVPEEDLGRPAPRRLLLQETEPGETYAVALTTNSGIYAYLLGDLVRIARARPWKLTFAGRTAHTLNAFGEHVSGGEMDVAILRAAEESIAEIEEYTVATSFPREGEPAGRHIWHVEFRRRPESIETFADSLDQALRDGNQDYATHRSYGLGAPRVEVIRPGGFYRWMAARGRVGGQNKVPRVTASPEGDGRVPGLACEAGCAR